METTLPKEITDTNRKTEKAALQVAALIQLNDVPTLQETKKKLENISLN